MFVSLSFELLNFETAVVQVLTAFDAVNPSLLSFPFAPFKYTTVAVAQFVYTSTSTSVEVVTDNVCAFVYEFVEIVPSDEVHPPNPYPDSSNAHIKDSWF